ncbi:hypothetical protein L6R50_21325 [Myxococcota bacterium]|nr:hypothetical protein [Myxococcota bacterium]
MWEMWNEAGTFYRSSKGYGDIQKMKDGRWWWRCRSAVTGETDGGYVPSAAEGRIAVVKALAGMFDRLPLAASAAVAPKAPRRGAVVKPWWTAGADVQWHRAWDGEKHSATYRGGRAVIEYDAFPEGPRSEWRWCLTLPGGGQLRGFCSSQWHAEVLLSTLLAGLPEPGRAR